MNQQFALTLCLLFFASCGTKTASGGGGGAADYDTADSKDASGTQLDKSDSAGSDDVATATDAAQPDVCLDADQDGFMAASCGGNDCDDTDPAVHPGAVETRDYKDNDCNGKIDDLTEAQLVAAGHCGYCVVTCGNGQVCTAGNCTTQVKTCSDACKIGDKKCQDGCTVVGCVATSGSGDCNTWGTSTTTCTNGTGCNLGECGPGGTCGKPPAPCMSDDYGTFVGQFSCSSTSFTDQQPLQYCGGGNVGCGGGSGCPVLFNHGYSAGCSNGSCNCEKIQ